MIRHINSLKIALRSGLVINHFKKRVAMFDIKDSFNAFAKISALVEITRKIKLMDRKVSKYA